MGWLVRLERVEGDSAQEIGEIALDIPSSVVDLSEAGLILDQAKRLLSWVQQNIVSI